MKTPLLAAAAAALAIAPPAFAQSAQEQLDARYDRALAAGYKALFLCSAIANAERNGATRTPESVEEWELTGIQAPLDGLISSLDYEIVRGVENPPGSVKQLMEVRVTWSRESTPRVAFHKSQHGCSLAPIESSGPISRDWRPQSAVPASAPVSFSNKQLASVVDNAFENSESGGTRTTAVVVRQNGSILGERYAGDFGPAVPQRTWSVAKSIAATLVGEAVWRGEVSLDNSLPNGFRRPVLDRWSAPTDGRRLITINHLLRMASGRYSDTPGNRTDPLYWGGSTVEETALHWPLVHEPGTVYRYANNDTLAAIKAIDSTFKEHPPADFFAKVGMYHTVAETDWLGDYIFSSQVWSTARDLAKLGQLYLDDGVLPDGTRILPEGWVEYVSSPSGPQPEGRSWGYGAGFWLFNQHEGIPKDTCFAAGNRGQYIVIVPSMNVVIVRRGEDPTGTRFDIEAFTRDVLESLEK